MNKNALLSKKDMVTRIKKIFDTQCLTLLDAKGDDYAHEVGTSEFRDSAAELSVDHYTVWNVHFNKHLRALKTWMKKRKTATEHISGRIIDLINYLFILLVIIEEDNMSEYMDENELYDGMLKVPTSVTNPSSGCDCCTAIGYGGLYNKSPNDIRGGSYKDIDKI